MIISTSELVPTANIAGLQAHVIELPSVGTAYVRRLKEVEHEKPFMPRTPAVVNPANPSRLILAVGETQAINPRSTASFTTQYLQTYDIASNYNVSRQALTRTNVTNLNVAPNAHRISEPIITHMQISYDGSWLATVDEWLPPKRDIESLSHGESVLDDEQRRRREVYLKFWQWQKADETWALVTRVDAPHTIASDDSGAGRVLGLAADPSSLAFSTIGEDGVVLVWRPRTRKRDGVVVRGENGEPISSWTCLRRVSLGSSELEEEAAISGTKPEHACLAFSEDGSILAASLNGGEDRLIHLVDPFTGTIRLTRPIMYRGDLISIAFVGQYLIMLSDDLRVYDLVLDELQYGISLKDFKDILSLEQKAEMIHLAVDRASRTFAVALPCRDDWTLEKRKAVESLSRAYSELAIFSPENPIPLYTQELPTLATAVIPAISSPGYIVLDAAAEITSLGPKASQSLISMARPMAELRLDLKNEEPEKDLLVINRSEEMDIDEDDEALEVSPGIEATDDIDDDGPPVVSQQQLARIFDIGPSFALPPIEEMFYQVADLFSSRPKA
jgi:NET1-associated nuclear protein 1 (U3 small nucleolar RNA-associated protein 17)